MQEIRTQKSYIGRMLCYIGWGIIVLSGVGFVLGFGEILELMDYSDTLSTFLISLRLTGLLVAVIAGFVFFGFSEIIRQLNLVSDSAKNEADKKSSVPKRLPNL